VSNQHLLADAIALAARAHQTQVDKAGEPYILHPLRVMFRVIVPVTLNGRTTARLVLDTGADVSVVKPQLLRSAGVDLLRPVARGTMSGVAGKVRVAYYAVNLEAAGHRALAPNVVAFDTFEDGFADGLLGRDFLDQFSVAMDPATGTVKLVPRQR